MSIWTLFRLLGSRKFWEEILIEQIFRRADHLEPFLYSDFFSWFELFDFHHKYCCWTHLFIFNLLRRALHAIISSLAKEKYLFGACQPAESKSHSNLLAGKYFEQIKDINTFKIKQIWCSTACSLNKLNLLGFLFVNHLKNNNSKATFQKSWTD